MSARILLVCTFLFTGYITCAQSSQKSIDSILNLLPTIKDQKKKVDALNTVSWDIAYIDFKKGISYALQAEKLAKKINYPKGLVKAYNTLGSTYSDMGVYDEALLYFDKALDMVQKNPKLHTFKGVIFFNLSRIYSFRGDLNKALTYTREAYNILMEKRDSSAMIMVGSTLGGIYSSLGNEDSAVFYFNQAIAVAEKSKDPYQIGVSHMQNAGHLIELEKWDDALVELQITEKVLRKLNDGYDLFTVYSDYGLISMKKGQTEKAIEYYLSALKEFGDNTTLSAKRDVYNALGNAYRKLNKFEKAYEAQATYIEINDSLNSEANKNQVIATEAKFMGEKSRLELDKVKAQNALQKSVIDNQQLYNIFAVVAVGVLLIVALIIFRGYRNKQRDNVIISTQKQLVEEKNKEITDSITYAKRIQNAIIPSPAVMQQHVGENFVLYKPKDIVAGDFYWIDSVNDLVLFAVCDCTGHGVPGALVSVVCHNALNRSVREFGLTQPAAILDKTRELVAEQFQKSAEEVKDGMDIALCAIQFRISNSELPGNSKSETRNSAATLLFSGANIPLWILRNGSNTIEEHKPTKQPIGYVEKPQPFTSVELQLNKGDLLYLCSDGYADQFGGEDGKKLKAATLKKMLVAINNQPMHNQHNTLHTELEKWKGNLEQVDDVCIMGIRL